MHLAFSGIKLCTFLKAACQVNCRGVWGRHWPFILRTLLTRPCQVCHRVPLFTLLVLCTFFNAACLASVWGRSANAAAKGLLPLEGSSAAAASNQVFLQLSVSICIPLTCESQLPVFLKKEAAQVCDHTGGGFATEVTIKEHFKLHHAKGRPNHHTTNAETDIDENVVRHDIVDEENDVLHTAPHHRPFPTTSNTLTSTTASTQPPPTDRSDPPPLDGPSRS